LGVKWVRAAHRRRIDVSCCDHDLGATERHTGALAAVPPSTSDRLRRWGEAVELRRSLNGWLASIALLAAVTGAIELLKAHVPVLSLGALYIFAVLPVAIVWGLAYAIPVSIASMAAFNFLFLPPPLHVSAGGLAQLDRARGLLGEEARRKGCRCEEGPSRRASSRMRISAVPPDWTNCFARGLVIALSCSISQRQ
jgi:hypothetical protein